MELRILKYGNKTTGVGVLIFFSMETFLLAVGAGIEALIGKGSRIVEVVIYSLLAMVPVVVVILIELNLRRKENQDITSTPNTDGGPGDDDSHGNSKDDDDDGGLKEVVTTTALGEQHELGRTRDTTPASVPTTNTEGGSGHDDSHGNGSGPADDRPKGDNEDGPKGKDHDSEAEDDDDDDNNGGGAGEPVVLLPTAAGDTRGEPALKRRKQFRDLEVAKIAEIVPTGALEPIALKRLNLSSVLLNNIASDNPDPIVFNREVLRRWRNMSANNTIEKLVSILSESGNVDRNKLQEVLEED